MMLLINSKHCVGRSGNIGKRQFSGFDNSTNIVILECNSSHQKESNTGHLTLTRSLSSSSRREVSPSSARSFNPSLAVVL